MDWKRYKIKFTYISIFVILFILSFTVSTFLGIDWYRSFWDCHERMLGLFTVAHYIVYYFIITSVVKKWEDWKWLLRVFLFAGGMVMFIAFIQQFNNEFLLNTSGNRSASTLGNSIYVGGYGLFLSLVGLLSAVREKNMIWRAFSIIGGTLGFLGVFFSGSRGAVLGLAAGLGLLFILYILLLKGHKRVKKNMVYIMIGAIVLLGVLYLFRETQFVRSIPSVGRLVNTTTLTSGTRMMAWDIAIQAWKEKPIIGWGPGNYYYAFNKYYNPEFLRYGYRETWFDNAHNIILNTLAEKGLVGTLIYLGLFAAAFISLKHAYKEKSLNINIFIVSVSFLFAHLVQTVSVFENPTSYLYFFFLLAFINERCVSKSDKEEDYPKKYKMPIGVIVMSVLAISLLIYVTNINPARANMASLHIIRGVYGLQDVTELYKKAISIPTPHIDDIRNDTARSISTALRRYVQSNKPEVSKAMFELAYNELNKNKELHPFDVRIHAQQAVLAQEAAGLSGNRSLLVEAESIMEDALSKSPKRQQFIYTLAGIKVQLQKVEEAEALYQKAIDDYYKIGESWWRLALLYSVTDNLDEAVRTINKAKELEIPIGAEGRSVIANILDKVEAVKEEVVEVEL